MRIIGEIAHPHLKITIFKMDNRISVKFENAQYEQTYKLGLDGRLESTEDVNKLVTPTFIQAVLTTFQAMHQTKMEALAQAFPVEDEIFEEII